MTDLLAYDFLRDALYAALLASVLCGLLGTFVVVKRLVFVSGGISHAAFGGLGACYFLGLDPRLGVAAVAVLFALVLGAVGRERVRSHDAAIGVLWAVGMAVGVAFVYKTPGYAPNLMTYLFGNILTVQHSDVLLTCVLAAVVLGFFVLFFKEVVAVAFDEEFAAVQGVPVRLLTTLVMVLVALSIVFLIQLVGIILVIALLTIPPLIGLEVARSFVPVIVVSTVVGSLISVGGLIVSYQLDFPSGPAIVLLGAALLLAVRGTAAAWRRARRERAVPAP